MISVTASHKDDGTCVASVAIPMENGSVRSMQHFLSNMRRAIKNKVDDGEYILDYPPGRRVCGISVNINPEAEVDTIRRMALLRDFAIGVTKSDVTIDATTLKACR